MNSSPLIATSSANSARRALEKDFLFVVGSPRSGTTWLQLMLGAHPSVCASTELRLYNKYTAPWLQAWREEVVLVSEGRPYFGLPVWWSETELHDYLRGFLEHVYARIIATKPQATHILDKHPQYAEFVEDIHFFLPRARIIHVIRDGRDVAVSLAAASRQLGWFAPETLAGYGAFWQRELLAARKAAAFTGLYLEVRYEALLAAPTAVLKSVFDFCGLSASEELVTRITEQHQFEKLQHSRIGPTSGVRLPAGHYRSGQVGNWRREFTALDRYLFDRAAGGLLRELGYAQSDWWAEGCLQRLWLPLAARGRSACRRAKQAGVVLHGRGSNGRHGQQP